MSNWANTAATLANKSHLKQSAESAEAAQTQDTSSKSQLGSASAKAALLAHKSVAASKVDTELSQRAAQSSLKDAKERALLAATKSFGTPKSPERQPLLSQTEKKDLELAQKRFAARQQESHSRTSAPPIRIKAEMLTEHPPIRMEVEEKRHQDALHASALSIARSVYKKDQEASGATPSTLTSKNQVVHYLSLQDKAQKLAEERLSKIKNPDESADYRNYYGVAPVSRSKSTRSNTVLQKIKHPRHHRSASSDDDLSRSRQVRSQMATLQTEIEKVDQQRATQDRARLMVAAQKKVTAQMHKMDADVFRDTGKMSPIMMSEWDVKSRQRHREQNQTSMRETQPDSAVNVGLGKLVDRADVEELANARVGPTLKGIDIAVEKRRAEDEAKKAAEEEKKQMEHEEKERKKEEKVEKKRIHDEEKRERKLKEQQLKTGQTVEEIVHTEAQRPVVSPVVLHETSANHEEGENRTYSLSSSNKQRVSPDDTVGPTHAKVAVVSKAGGSNADQEAKEPGLHETQPRTSTSPDDHQKRTSKLKKAFHRRSKDEKDLKQNTTESKHKSSKIRSALTKLKRRSGSGAAATGANHETGAEGESTELEDSDSDSFHSTSSLPTTAALEDSRHEELSIPTTASVLSTDVISQDGQPPLQNTSVGKIDVPNHDDRNDKLQGAHIETKFHEEL